MKQLFIAGWWMLACGPLPESNKTVTVRYGDLVKEIEIAGVLEAIDAMPIRPPSPPQYT